MTPTPETERFSPVGLQNRDRQTLAHMAISAVDDRERSRLRRVRRAGDLHHTCLTEIRLCRPPLAGPELDQTPCPVCGTVLKTLDDYIPGGS